MGMNILNRKQSVISVVWHSSETCYAVGALGFQTETLPLKINTVCREAHLSIRSLKGTIRLGG